MEDKIDELKKIETEPSKESLVESEKQSESVEAPMELPPGMSPAESGESLTGMVPPGME